MNLFKELYGERPPEGTVLNICKPQGKNFSADPFKFDDVTDWDEIYRKIDDWKETRNIYFEVCLQNTLPKYGKRGKADTTALMPGVWFDMDFEHSVHKKKALPTQDECLDFIESLEKQPTLIVNSGNGYHLYWLFNEPFIFQLDMIRDIGKSISKGFQKYIIEKGRERGWNWDNTADLARVLRVPGTFNHKDGNMREVIMEKYDENLRYTPDNFHIYTSTSDSSKKSTPKTSRSSEEKYTPRTDLPPADINPIVDGCPWMAHCRDDAETLTEPEWLAMLSILSRCENGEGLAHEWSEPYPEYDYPETDQKLIHSMKAGPRTCQNIEENLNGYLYCYGCEHRKKITSPIALGMKKEEPEKTEAYNLTDKGNAERFADMHCDKLRYCETNNSWYAWDGKRWGKGNSKILDECTDQTIESLWELGRQHHFVRHAHRSESATALRNMKNMAKPKLSIASEAFDLDDWKLNCQNGTIDLKTGKLKPFNREDFISKIIPVKYNPYADCPKFKKFLSKILNGRQEMIDYFQKVFGYTLTGNVSEQCFFHFKGEGSNGKSTLIEIIRHIMGDYAVNARAETFLQNNKQAIREDLMRLKDARLVTASEFNKESWLDDGVVKSMTGGDQMTARNLYEGSSEYTPKYNIILLSNPKINITSDDFGIKRRYIPINFDVKFSGNQVDPDLKSRLIEEEAEGILWWMIEGCLKWQSEKLKPHPQYVQDSIYKYWKLQNSLKYFMYEMVEKSTGHRTLRSDLYDAYKKWYEEGLDDYDGFIGRNTFNHTLENYGFKSIKSSNNYWLDIKLKSSDGDNNNNKNIFEDEVSEIV